MDARMMIVKALMQALQRPDGFDRGPYDPLSVPGRVEPSPRRQAAPRMSGAISPGAKRTGLTLGGVMGGKLFGG